MRAEWTGHYLDGRSAARQAATVRITPGGLEILLADTGTRVWWPYAGLRQTQGFYAGEQGFDQFDRKYAAIGYLFEHRFNEVATVRSSLRYVSGSFDWTAVQFMSLAANNRTVNRYALRSQSEAEARVRGSISGPHVNGTGHLG